MEESEMHYDKWMKYNILEKSKILWKQNRSVMPELCTKYKGTQTIIGVMQLFNIVQKFKIDFDVGYTIVYTCQNS